MKVSPMNLNIFGSSSKTAFKIENLWIANQLGSIKVTNVRNLENILLSNVAYKYNQFMRIH